MSIHSSLRSAGAGKKHRSVLKRYERLKVLKDKNVWDEGKTVLGLVKVKMQKLKVKKEVKAAAAPATAGAAPAKAAAPAAKAAPAKDKK
jgi:small basic protein (TIGR04137 family)